MSDFNHRWQTVIGQARRVPEHGRVDALPLGMATRILAQLREAPVEPWMDLLAALGLRAALATTCVLLAGTGLAVAQWYEFRIEPPELENVLPIDLTWP